MVDLKAILLSHFVSTFADKIETINFQSIDDPPMSEDDLDNLLKDFNQALGETPPEEREGSFDGFQTTSNLLVSI